MVLRGIGVGLAFMPAMTAAFASLQRSELSDATPQMNVAPARRRLDRHGRPRRRARSAPRRQHRLDDAAAAFGTAFWWSVGITAAAIIPCIVLVRAERAHARGDELRDRVAHRRQLAESAA